MGHLYTNTAAAAKSDPFLQRNAAIATLFFAEHGTATLPPAPALTKAKRSSSPSSLSTINSQPSTSSSDLAAKIRESEQNLKLWGNRKLMATTPADKAAAGARVILWESNLKALNARLAVLNA